MQCTDMRAAVSSAMADAGWREVRAPISKRAKRGGGGVRLYTFLGCPWCGEVKEVLAGRKSSLKSTIARDHLAQCPVYLDRVDAGEATAIVSRFRRQARRTFGPPPVPTPPPAPAPICDGTEEERA